MISYLNILKPECKSPTAFPLLHLDQDMVTPLFQVEGNLILIGDHAPFYMDMMNLLPVTPDRGTVITAQQSGYLLFHR